MKTLHRGLGLITTLGPLVSGLLVLGLLGMCSIATITAAERPNIVLVLADDLGYGDLSCFGARDVHSPNLDRFASQGLKLTSCYAGHANCSPSRTALMTGRTPTRVGIRNWIPQNSPVHLRRSEVTVATLLKNLGYSTCHVGKWHLNGEFNAATQPQPADHGFDYWFSTQNNALPNHHNPENFVRNGVPVGKIEGYSAHIVVDEAINWLQKGRTKDQPFFLFVCFHEPHEPIASDPKYSKYYPTEDLTYAAHHGNLTQMDHAFGRLLKSLDDQGLNQNTLVLFTSDNGPAITPMHPHGSSGPLRDKKGAVYEGGIRVPGILRWTGKVKPNSVSDEPVCGVDFLPTVCAITGIPLPSGRVIDGASLLPILNGERIVRAQPLYWHFNRATSAPKVALRQGDWKILAELDRVPLPRNNDITMADENDFKQAKLHKFSLYNLKSDIAEKEDLAEREPQKLSELKTLLETKYRQVLAESPVWPEWKFTNYEGPRIVYPDFANKRQRAAAGKN